MTFTVVNYKQPQTESAANFHIFYADLRKICGMDINMVNGAFIGIADMKYFWDVNMSYGVKC